MRTEKHKAKKIKKCEKPPPPMGAQMDRVSENTVDAKFFNGCEADVSRFGRKWSGAKVEKKGIQRRGKKLPS